MSKIVFTPATTKVKIDKPAEWNFDPVGSFFVRELENEFRLIVKPSSTDVFGPYQSLVIPKETLSSLIDLLSRVRDDTQGPAKTVSNSSKPTHLRISPSNPFFDSNRTYQIVRWDRDDRTCKDFPVIAHNGRLHTLWVTEWTPVSPLDPSRTAVQTPEGSEGRYGGPIDPKP